MNGRQQKRGHRRDRISWTPEEDAILRAGVEAGKGWTAIIADLPGRTDSAAQKRANGLGLVAVRWEREIEGAIATAARVRRREEFYRNAVKARQAREARTNGDVDAAPGSRD